MGNIATLSFETSTGQSLSIDSHPDGNSDISGGGGGSTDFVVDRKLDIEILQKDTNIIATAPDAWGYLTFDVTNNGNDLQDVLLDAHQLNGASDAEVTAAGGGADNQDAASVKICSDVPDAAGNCTTITSLQDVAADGNATTIYVAAQMDTAANVANGEYVLISLRGQVAYATNGTTAIPAGASAGAAIGSDDGGDADDREVIQNVFADASGPGTDGAGAGDIVYDGFHSDVWAFEIVEANVTVTKDAEAVWDPFSCDSDTGNDNGSTGNDPGDATGPTGFAVTCGDDPKAIPGAYVEYTITIENAAGSATAENLSLTDVLNDANAPFVTDAFNDDAVSCNGVSPCGIYVLGPYTGTPPATGTPHSNANDLDASNYNATNQTVTSTLPALTGGQSYMIKFRVEVQ